MPSGVFCRSAAPNPANPTTFGIQSFELAGNKDKTGKAIFLGKYGVKVTGEMKIVAKEEPKPTDKKKSKKNESMDDAEKPGMSESMDEDEMKNPKPKK